MNTRTTMIASTALLALVATHAHAEETVCRSALGAVTVDNLRVPPGARCELSGTWVAGTVLVERGAVLIGRQVRVVGNVQAENARNVRLARARVGGSVQLKQGGAASIVNSTISGDLQLDSNRAALKAATNRIGGSLQAFQNTGGLEISGSRIDGNLQCKENTPPPVGGANVVHGSKEDQGAALGSGRA